MTYLDYNATAPLRPAARDAMLRWLGPPANPSSAHRYGRDAAMAVDNAREAVAALAACHRDAVVFTSGATEANATVLSQGRWLVSATEHPSALTWATRVVPVDENGVIRLAELDALADGMDGVSVQLANNETGVIQPVEDVIRWARTRGLRTHVDAAQGPGRVATTVVADFITLSAHKFGGPTGAGALVVRARSPVAPLLRGGPQERGWRAGTSAVAAIAGMGAAARAVAEHGVGEIASMAACRAVLEARLRELGGVILGGDAARLPNTTCAVWRDVDAADLVVALDLAGFAVSAGAACASGSMKRSHVLDAMGVAGTAVRFSTGWGTTLSDIARVTEVLPDVLRRFGAAVPARPPAPTG